MHMYTKGMSAHPALPLVNCMQVYDPEQETYITFDEAMLQVRELEQQQEQQQQQQQ